MERANFGMPYLCETAEIADAAALCAALGLGFVELNMSFPKCAVGEISAGTLLRLRERYGVYFTLHLEENFDVCAFNPRVRGAYLETFKEACMLARAIEAPVLNMHLARGVYITLPEERVYLYARERAMCLEQLGVLRGLAEAAGVCVAVENTEGFSAGERERAAFLLESPSFGLTLDIGHSHCVGDCDLPFYDAHRDRLIHMHAHDALGKRNHLAFGDGEIDLAERLNRARAANARVVLETKTVAALEKSVPQLREFGGTL